MRRKGEAATGEIFQQHRCIASIGIMGGECIWQPIAVKAADVVYPLIEMWPQGLLAQEAATTAIDTYDARAARVV